MKKMTHYGKKTDKSNIIRIKNACSTEDPGEGTTKRTADRERMFASHVPREGAASRMQKESSEHRNGQTTLREKW